MIHLSPVSGRPLLADTPHSLAAGRERWPVIDGIAYLRAGSEALAAEAVRALDAGSQTDALCLLLAENDRWWDQPPPPDAQLRQVVAQRDTLGLRQAMDLLGYGRVGTYFAHRWSDPTYVAGLGLLDAHWTEPRSVLELGCGIGHYLREIGRLGIAATGGDIVFSKLWVARHWVAGPAPNLVCFDADVSWPFAIDVDLAFCHDAFYFFNDKPHVAACLLAAAARGAVLLSHIHNRAWPNFSSGAAVALQELLHLFPDATLYDDQALTLAAVTGGVPAAGGRLDQVEAFAVATGPALRPARAARGPLSCPAERRRLRRNPICTDGTFTWPSYRYAQEYGPRATYRCDGSVPEEAEMGAVWAEAAARRDLLDLPERW